VTASAWTLASKAALSGAATSGEKLHRHEAGKAVRQAQRLGLMTELHAAHRLAYGEQPVKAGHQIERAQHPLLHQPGHVLRRFVKARLGLLGIALCGQLPEQK